EKKLLPPGQLPADLHWFKWQNFFTWISGMFLLVVVYYLNGGAFLVDAGKGLHPHLVMTIGVGVIVGSWVVYHGIWRALGRVRFLPHALSALLLGVSILVLTHFLSGRAAYIHVGVVIGTLMTGNVWHVILPAQRELIAATKEGREQNPELGDRAKQRSIHNNYLTFPLLFIMISNHFPSTWGSEWNWLVLMVVTAAGAGVRHFMNIRFTYRSWFAPALAIVAVAVGTLLLLTHQESASARVPEGPVPS